MHPAVPAGGDGPTPVPLGPAGGRLGEGPPSAGSAQRRSCLREVTPSFG
jgi:hypothetical protein